MEPPLLRRFSAEACAWRESAAGEAAVRGARFRACSLARARRGFGRRPAFSLSCAALRRTLGVASGPGGASTPARRAFDSPIAIACLAFLAPCLPSRMWCISSRTNSPACVEPLLPSARSCLAFSNVFLLGMSDVKQQACQCSPRCAGPAFSALWRKRDGGARFRVVLCRTRRGSSRKRERLRELAALPGLAAELQ